MMQLGRQITANQSNDRTACEIRPGMLVDPSGMDSEAKGPRRRSGRRAGATGCDLDRQRDTQRAVLDLREYLLARYHSGRVWCAQSTTPKDFAFFGVVSGRYWARTSDP